MSSSSKGNEREDFLSKFLGQVFPPTFRFGTGDATDHHSNRSGQLDIVVEHPFGLSLTATSYESSRLYLAEAVAAVIEVKSDLSDQWTQFKQTAQQLEPLKRDFGFHVVVGGPGPETNIPIFAVGYMGWKTPETLAAKFAEVKGLRGILTLDPPLYHGRNWRASGEFALWAFICELQQTISSLQSASPSLIGYITSD
jgi:hypothetical protein